MQPFHPLVKTIYRVWLRARLTKLGSLLLVSGGVDSLALLFLMHTLVQRGRLAPFEVLHVNYGLQENAHEAAQLVRETCNRLVLPVTIVQARLGAKLQSAARTINIQAEARAVRYRHAETLLQKRGLAMMVTAHHADDMVETFLWKLGMAQSPLALTAPRQYNGKLFRPLLAIWKADLQGYVQAEGIDYTEDPSNQQAVYLRNTLRRQVLPLMQQVMPQFGKAVMTVRGHLTTLTNLQSKLLAFSGMVRQGLHACYLAPQFAERLTLTAAERLQLLHELLLRSYPARRFSSGELRAIALKLSRGRNGALLFSAEPYGKVYYSHGLIAPVCAEGPLAADAAPLPLAADAAPLPLAVDAAPLPLAVDAAPVPLAVDAAPVPLAVDAVSLQLAAAAPRLEFTKGCLQLMKLSAWQTAAGAMAAAGGGGGGTAAIETAAARAAVRYGNLCAVPIPHPPPSVVRWHILPLTSQRFHYKGKMRTGAFILKTLKIPYPFQVTSWVIASAEEIAKAEFAAVFSPYSISLAAAAVYEWPALAPLFFCNDAWHDYLQVLAKQRKNSSIGGTIGQRWLLVWESTVKLHENV